MDSSTQKDNIGLVADIIAIVTFIFSLLDVAFPNFPLKGIELGENYSPSRLLITGLIIYSTCYFATTRVIQKISRYDSDMNSALYLDALITFFTGWVYCYSLVHILSYNGAQSIFFFSIAYFFSVILYYYFYQNNYKAIQPVTTHKSVPPFSSFAIFYSFWLMAGKNYEWIYIGGFSFAFFLLSMGVLISRDNS